MKRINFFFLLLFILSSCGEELMENDPTTLPDVIPNPSRTDIVYPTDEIKVLTSIIGRIVDSDGLPLSAALVACLSCEDTSPITSEEDGSFNFQSVTNLGEQAYLSVEYHGKFETYRRMPLIENRQNYTSIMLRDKNKAGSINTSVGGTVSLSNGSQLSIPQAGISDAAGKAYSGDYEVYMSWIDPTDTALNESMMGDLSGIDLENNLTGLSTFGMLQVELETADGTQLNLADGVLAELTFPVPAELRDIAPSVIPLWSYDETEGYWIEEGEANLVGDTYVGSVSHFSTWNVDAKINPIDLCGQIQINSRETVVGLPFFEINLSGDSFTSVGGWLCDDGSFTFANVPAGETLILDITNYCGEIIETLELGPFAEDTKLDPIVITDNNSLNEVLIQGNALTCDGNAISNGSVQIRMGERRLTFPLDNQGQFLFVVPLCTGTTATLNILNLDDFSTTAPITLSGLNDNYTLDNVTLCEENEEYFYMEWKDEFLINSETQTALAVNPLNLWYEKVQDEYLFKGIFDLSNPVNCWDTNGNGIGDPGEDTNGDGVFNELDCIGTNNGQDQIVFAFTQDLILNQVIPGVEDDGYRFEPAVTLIGNGETYEFLFTEIGPLNAQGLPTVIAGSFNGYLTDNFSIKGSFRLKPE